MVVDKNQVDQSAPDSPETGEANGVEKIASEVRSDSALEVKLSQARASRSQAEVARQRIITEIMEATKELYQKLVAEGEFILSKAKQLQADAELRSLEAERELEHSHTVRSEADSYREKVITQTQKQAQEMVQQAQAIKAEAVAFREKLLAQVREQAQQELDQAQSEKLEADTYRERVIAQAQVQAQEILEQARQAAEQEGSEIVQRYSVEAEKLLAQAELIKAAAQEELEAQRLYSEVASLETESKEVLERARAELRQGLSYSEYHSGGPATYSPVSPDPGPEVADESPQYEDMAEQSYDSEADYSQREDYGYDEALMQPDPDQQDGLEDYEETSDRDDGLTQGELQLADNDLVLGIEIGDRSKAYPLRIVTEAKVINDSLNGQDLLVTFGPPSELGMIFKRDVDGLTLTFEPISETANGLMLMQDRETETVWEALTGRAIRGSLAHAELDHLNSEYSFWFAWSELHPDTDVYWPDETSPEESAEPDEDED